MNASIKIFADGADVRLVAQQAGNPRIAGFTTNPSLMRAAGVPLYRAGSSSILSVAAKKPVSIEVLADDLAGMEREARGIAALATNAVVTVPVVNSAGESTVDLIANLARVGIPLNVTAVFTREQVAEVGKALGGVRNGLGRGKRVPTEPAAPVIVSIFAGRIADAGTDPLEHVTACRKMLRELCPAAQMLWASPRQVYDVLLAARAGCEIITLSSDLIAKLELGGKDLTEYSRETSAQFHQDAVKSGYAL